MSKFSIHFLVSKCKNAKNFGRTYTANDNYILFVCVVKLSCLPIQLTLDNSIMPCQLVSYVSIFTSVEEIMFGEGYSGVRAAVIILIICTPGHCQNLKVFVTKNNNTVDKRAKVHEPLMKIEDFQGYSICFRDPSREAKKLNMFNI